MKLKCLECEKPDGSKVLLINPGAVVYVEYDEDSKTAFVTLQSGERLKLVDKLETFVKFYRHKAED